MYGDHGADYHFMSKTIQANFPNHSIVVVSKDELLDTENFTPEKVTAFFLPGATRGQYDVRLGEEGFQAIRNYVEQGGVYAGFCAGTYYASRRFEWRIDDGDDARIKHPSLRFFNGVSKGPITELLARDNPDWRWDDIRAVSIQTEMFGNKDIMNVLYWGGPLLTSDTPIESEFQVIARFDDLAGKPPCIISKNEGKGLVILSSVHPETTLLQLQPFADNRHQKSDQFRRLFNDLAPSEHKRVDLWNYLMMKIKGHARVLEKARLRDQQTPKP